MQGHKKAEASPSSSGVHSGAGLFFYGWCREGYWSNGSLLKGKEGRVVNLTKFLHQRPQAPRAPQTHLQPAIGPEFVLELPSKFLYEIPVFMESHL